MITELSSKPEFYRVAGLAHMQIIRPLLGVPGIRWGHSPLASSEKLSPEETFNSAIVHRSHLPLLDAPDARTLLAVSSDAAVWEARDQRAAKLGIKLRTTQQQAVDFILRRRGTLLGDDPRVGKTVSAIWAHDPLAGPLVIIAPLSTRAVWLGWLRRVFPETPIGVITGKAFNPEIMHRPIVFGHYDVIHKWQALFEIGTLVLDEAHLLTNREARRTIAAALLQSRAKRVIAMTGTPVWNMPPGLWSILGLVTPGAWGDFYEFADRYGAPEATAYGKIYTGVSNETELHARLTEVMLRRRWIDVRNDLPAISRSVVVAEVSETDQRKLDILAGQLKSERTNTIGNLAAYRRQVTRLKLPVTCSEASKTLSRGEPVVVWTWHRDFAEQISRRLEGSFLIHGEIPADLREARMDAWRASPTPQALVATMAVAQVGIDLSHARFAIFGEIDYTPAILGQAEMRTFTPDRPMSVSFVVANHLIDQRIIRALVSKLSAADPLGVAAARDSIDALRECVFGPENHGDLDRLLGDFLASAE